MHEYYEYQIKISEEEYLKMSKDGFPPKGMSNRVIEIPIFRNCEFDIKKLCNNYNSISDKIFNCEDTTSLDLSLLKSSLYDYLNNSHASYLAPAYNYNCYLNLLIENNIKRMNNDNMDSLENADYYYTIIIQNLLISIKSLLDRTVPIFSFYYNGFSLETTFGHFNFETSKATGSMQTVIQKKQKDKLMEFIYNEYCNWIKYIVEPRNTIIHYNDLQSQYRYAMDERQFPMHYNIKIFGKTVDDRTFYRDDGFYYKSLMSNVQDIYYFLDMIFNVLIKKKIIYRKEHFIENEAYENYRNNL